MTGGDVECLQGMKSFREAFTLMELLICVSLIALLMGLLSPVLKNARDAAKKAACTNNLRNIGHAAIMYANENGGWLPHSGNADMPVITPNQTWKWLIAPYLGISSPSKQQLENNVFRCPAQKNPTCGTVARGDNGFYGGYGWNFLYLGWRDAVTSGTKPWINLSQVGNPAQTIMAGDTSDYQANGAYPARVFYLYDSDASGELSLSQSYRHNGGGNYLWVDGHVSWHSAADVWDHRTQWFPIP